MASTNIGTAGQTADRDRQNGSDRRTPKWLSSTETRRSFITSEFWLALGMAALLVIVGYADDDGLGITRAWELAAGIVGLYILSRGIAKAGSRDPQIRDLDELR
jgi:hypothetical protein